MAYKFYQYLGLKPTISAKLMFVNRVERGHVRQTVQACHWNLTCGNITRVRIKARAILLARILRQSSLHVSPVSLYRPSTHYRAPREPPLHPRHFWVYL